MAKKKISRATKGLFNRFFGFETGIDITNEVAVLHRRNVVIKNIIFVSNMFYSLILGIFAFFSETQANWLIPAIFFPFTFFINSAIKHLIHTDRHDKTRQQIGMYAMAFYIFITVILLYAKFFHEEYFETTIYVLIYYSVVIISLYQSKSLMIWSMSGMIAVITIIHFTWTYNVSSLAEGLSIFEFLQEFIYDPRFYDLLLRTLVFIIFSVVVFAIVSIGHYMQEERKNELLRRREIQEDFTNIVSDLFKVVLSAKSSFIDQVHINLVHKMSLHLANLFGVTDIELEEIDKYAKIHLRFPEIKILIDPEEAKEIDYNELKIKTELGTLIAKRLQLAQKVDDIARTHVEGAVTDEFILEMQQVQPELTSQIILLCDLYISMRGQQSYKRAYPNKIVLDLFEKEFNVYFNYQLLDRFLRFGHEFEKMYNDA